MNLLNTFREASKSHKAVVIFLFLSGVIIYPIGGFMIISNVSISDWRIPTLIGILTIASICSFIVAHIELMDLEANRQTTT